ncbi:class 1 fructose-bisphosphatase [Paralysiella testudinis]|uniref:Fructose-1,6-bisphosphatase class 1 n=1 Tax=Paralysiella testudinis TaxID=2809020 RepID=A0A892ZF97_9NEIS|nr:class 1 fructose-bisphosphatase [Paralysiella testudinis]QRQ81313.1 class 1 fructose-bisphosphatase [Paralysiella testudinis]
MSATLPDFLHQHLAEHHLPPALGSVISSICQACVSISAQVRVGALSGILGSAGSGNIQGEEQKKLDVIANNTLVGILQQNPAVAGLASEEEDSFVAANADGGYLVLFDPLDGSSNIDVNISIGTIFSVLAKPSGSLNTASFLQPGRAQVASGYVLYGPQTLLVLTLGHGITVFTLNNEHQFVLTQSNPIIPPATQEFAINMSNQRHWQAPVQDYISELLAGDTGVRGKNYNMRWVASMVAEVHRILMRGGVFLYPQDAREPGKPGKLRLMYEANPLSLLVEQAGGAATNAHTRMLDIQPEGLHQRVAVVLGSKNEVDYISAKHQA